MWRRPMSLWMRKDILSTRTAYPALRDRAMNMRRECSDYGRFSEDGILSNMALIPFLENDDANRALMGSNMQRQAVPLLMTEAPVVGTGMEEKSAVDSGVCVIAETGGVVERSTSTEITIRQDDGNLKRYKMIKFLRSNQSNCYNQRPIVFKGDQVI